MTDLQGKLSEKKRRAKIKYVFVNLPAKNMLFFDKNTARLNFYKDFCCIRTVFLQDMTMENVDTINVR